MRRWPIRTRLTVWYSAVLAATLGLFAVFAFEEIRRSLLSAVDDELRERIGDLQTLAAPDPAHFLEELLPHTGSKDILQVVDAAGAWTYRSPEAVALDLALPPTPESGWGFSTFRRNGITLRAAAKRVSLGGKPYVVEFAEPITRYEQSVRGFGIFVLLASPVLLGAAAAGGWWMSRRALAPVDRITEEARVIGAESLSRRLEIPEPEDELRRLSLTLNEMLSRIEEGFHQVRDFTAAASHELRTPLALMQSLTEVALRRPRSEAEHAEVLGQVLQELKRTAALVNDLLLLARADAGSPMRKERLDLVAAVRESCTRGRELAERKEIIFRDRLSEKPLVVEGDGALLQRIFYLLVDNAVKYTPFGGEVEVVLLADGGAALGQVRDTGIGISPEDLPHVFERFFRTDKARTRDSGGAGLGLAIGQWIAEAHGGALHAESRLGEGSVFSVRIPLAR